MIGAVPLSFYLIEIIHVIFYPIFSQPIVDGICFVNAVLLTLLDNEMVKGIIIITRAVLS